MSALFLFLSQGEVIYLIVGIILSSVLTHFLLFHILSSLECSVFKKVSVNLFILMRNIRKINSDFTSSYNLQFSFINNILISNSLAQLVQNSKEEWSNQLLLKPNMSAHHFAIGEIVLKCEAPLPNLCSSNSCLVIASPVSSNRPSSQSPSLDAIHPN